MTTYKHPDPELSDREVIPNKNEFVERFNVLTGYRQDEDFYCTLEQLLALGFEEVKEVKEEKENDETTYGSDCNITTNEENDRIYNVFNEFCDKKRQDIRDFRNVIERYLPKNKKPTKSEVAIYCYRTKNIVLEQPMIDFLRDHDLLEE